MSTNSTAASITDPAAAADARCAAAGADGTAHGHAAGNDVLRATGEAVGQRFGNGSFAGRHVSGSP